MYYYTCLETKQYNGSKQIGFLLVFGSLSRFLMDDQLIPNQEMWMEKINTAKEAVLFPKIKKSCDLPLLSSQMLHIQQGTRWKRKRLKKYNATVRIKRGIPGLCIMDIYAKNAWIITGSRVVKLNISRVFLE